MFGKKILTGLLLTSFFSGFWAATPASSQSFGKDESKFDYQSAQAVSTTIVISQYQGGGTNSTGGALDDDEFVELHNVGSTDFDLNGHTLFYRSASGTTDLTIFSWSSTTIIPAGKYYLVARSGTTGYNGTVTPDATFGSLSLSGSNGGVGIRNASGRIDSLAFGSVTNGLNEGTAAPAPTRDGSLNRRNNGCLDTDNNASDFENLALSVPHNLSSSANICGGGTSGTTLTASGAANPGSVLPGAVSKLTVTVNPVTTPNPSTGIAVSVDLTPIGGAANQTFFDNATNGDQTAANNVFTFDATVASGTTVGTKTLPATVTDAQSRTATTTISLTVTSTSGGGSHSPEEHLVMGNPCNATTDINNESNYLLSKLQYAVGYNRARAIPNWVSWHLDSSWLGSTGRQENFSPDQTLPAGWYRVTDGSYTGSGFTRGHHTPSGDRTSSVTDNSATFLMTNMMPQSAANNNGPWNTLENESRNLVSAGNELYIVMGGSGKGGTGTNGYAETIDAGRVTVPSQTWKLIVVLPVGDNDAARVTSATRVIGVIMPNTQTINADWKKYIATVDQIEALSGCDYLTNVDPAAQAVIEAKVDAASNTAPVVTNRTLTPAEDNSVTIAFTGTDFNENNVLDYAIVTPPANGTIRAASNLAPGATSFVYTPNPNFFGTDSFTYKANDSAADSNVATVNVTVSSVNDAPVAAADARTMYKNMTATFPAADLTGNDTAGAANEAAQSLTVTNVITTPQTRGTVSLVNGQITYKPDLEYTGAASFDYQVCDNGTTNGTADPKCATGTVNYTVLAPSAGAASIAGRILTAKGRGISGAVITAIDAAGRAHEIRSNAFGYYRLADLVAGESYVLSVRHKTYTFGTQVVGLAESAADINFTAQK